MDRTGPDDDQQPVIHAVQNPVYCLPGPSHYLRGRVIKRILAQQMSGRGQLAVTADPGVIGGDALGARLQQTENRVGPRPDPGAEKTKTAGG